MKEQKRKNIQDIATKLFVEKGFENTSTRDIAKAAGISKPTLYYYFDSKEDILFKILDEVISTGSELIRKIGKSNKALKEKLTSVTMMHGRFFTVDTDKMKLFVNNERRREQTNKNNHLQANYNSTE